MVCKETGEIRTGYRGAIRDLAKFEDRFEQVHETKFVKLILHTFPITLFFPTLHSTASGNDALLPG
jgi:hypothetical protein